MNWFDLIDLLASAPAPAPVPAPGDGSGAAPAPGWLQFLASPLPLMMLLIFVLFWFSISAKRKQERQRREMLDAVKKGDRIQTIGGMLGTVVDVRDDRVVVKVDESNNTKIAFAKAAVHRVLAEDGKADNTPAR